MISNGQARRISAEWQAPSNAFSALQHKGEILADLPTKIRDQLEFLRMRRSSWPEDEYAEVCRDLEALDVFSSHHGPCIVESWGDWDDTPVTAEDLT